MLANSDVQIISGGDLKADEQISNNLAGMRASIVLDVNFLTNSCHGLSQNHGILRRLSNRLHNNVDFDNKRFA